MRRSPATATTAPAAMPTPKSTSRPPRRSARAPSPAATTAMSTPKLATMAAPVGRSQAKEAHSPAALTAAPSTQPMARRPRTELVRSAPTAAGTMR